MINLDFNKSPLSKESCRICMKYFIPVRFALFLFIYLFMFALVAWYITTDPV